MNVAVHDRTFAPPLILTLSVYRRGVRVAYTLCKHHTKTKNDEVPDGSELVNGSTLLYESMFMGKIVVQNTDTESLFCMTARDISCTLFRTFKSCVRHAGSPTRRNGPRSSVHHFRRRGSGDPLRAAYMCHRRFPRSTHGSLL